MNTSTGIAQKKKFYTRAKIAYFIKCPLPHRKKIKRKHQQVTSSFFWEGKKVISYNETFLG